MTIICLLETFLDLLVILGIYSDQQERTSTAIISYLTEFAVYVEEPVTDVCFEWICNKTLFIAAD